MILSRSMLVTRFAPVALAAMVAGPVVGQGQPESRPGQQSQQAPAPTIDISFRGGSIGDYLKAVKDAAAPIPVNVIISDDVARLKANPVELQGVSVETALHLLMQGQVLTPESVSVRPTAAARDSAQVYLISSNPTAEERSRLRPPPPPPPPPSVRVFSIRNLVEPDPGTASLALDPETIISSIDAAMSLHGDDEQRDVLFHPEAGVLIVRASSEELAVVTSLLQEIDRDMSQRRSNAQREAAWITALQKQVRELQPKLDLAQSELEIAQRRFDQAEHHAEGGMASQHDVEEAHLNLLRMQAQYQAISEEYHGAQESLERRRAAPAGDDRQSLLNEITRLKAEVAALRAQLGRSAGGQDEGRGGR